MLRGNHTILIAVLIVLLPVIPFSSTTNSSSELSQPTISQLGKMPLAFTENRGQWDEKIKFRANAGGATMWFAPDGAYYQFTRSISKDESQVGPVDPINLIDGRMDREREEYETIMIKASFVGANPSPKMVGTEMMEYKCNYFIGNIPNEWHTDVPNFGAVVYEHVYDGIDLKYYGNGQQMEYDFIVSPGADFSQIKIQYEGAESVSINTKGELIVKTKWGEVIEQRPVIYQIEDDRRVPVIGEYNLKSDNSFGFELSGYNPALLLVIDPVLSYSTYLGGSNIEEGWNIAVDDLGSAYIVGRTLSLDFPATDNAYQDTLAGSFDVFVTKISSSGDGLVYSTYIGGPGMDYGRDIGVDGSGNAYITGSTTGNFPTTIGAYDPNGLGGGAFVTKLNSSGNDLIYSTYLGGGGYANGWGIAVDNAGAAYIVGFTVGGSFPTVNPYQEWLDGFLFDGFVSKLNSAGSALIYSTYLGGSNWDECYDIAVDDFGCAYITGMTWSTDFPTVGAFQATHQLGYRDAFVTKLNSSGNDAVYSTYLGGDGADHGFGIALDSSGNAYVTGNTSSTNFPTEGPIQNTLAGASDVFVTKLNGVGDGLVYSTYLGGSAHDGGHSIAVDGPGRAVIVGRTYSTDFPTESAFQLVLLGSSSGFVTQLNPAGDAIVFSTYLGGSSEESIDGIAMDDAGSVYLTGKTISTDFPTVQEYQSAQGDMDAFVVKIANTGTDSDGDWIVDDVDCDDGDPTIHPGAVEIPDDGIDQDCNGFDAVTCYVDVDQDGYGNLAGTVVIADDGSCNAAQQESDNMMDCDDAVASINPGAPEIPDDGIDQNCNGFDAITCILDADQDGYGIDVGTVVIAVDGSCDILESESVNSDDCDDGDPAINPDAIDILDDGIDQDCDGSDATCCGLYTTGYTGNTNCDMDGKRNLADITKLIDAIYLSKVALCCPQNGNVNGDAEAKINLADITKLIDHVYISKAETAGCE